MIRYERRD